MIVKILSNAGSFAGINYNERKNDQGSSELLLAENFDALGHSESEVSKIDYVNYLKMISSLNPRVDKKQFHAIISTQGRMHTPEELRDIAVKYLEQMGYGENPYLIYSHSDTANNHVHIVTSRVNKQGKKIDDSYERVRSQKVIQEIMAQNPQEKLKSVLKDVLQYQCTTLAQCNLLLERQGYHIQDKANDLNIIKHGVVLGVLSKETLKQSVQVRKSAVWKARADQLKAIFSKYKSGMDTDYFIQFARQKFGLEIVLHQKKGHDMPYGYTILDHRQKYTFKGSQIMSLDRLLDSIPYEEKLKNLQNIIEAVTQDNTLGYTSLKKEIQSLGFQLDHQGQIFRVGEEGPDLAIDSELLKQSKYQDRTLEALSYQIGSEGARRALARLFFISPEVLRIQEKKETLAKEVQIMRDKLKAVTLYYEINEGLKNFGLEVIKHRDQHFILDRESKMLFEYPDVGNELPSLQQADITNLDRLPSYRSTTKRQALEEQVARRCTNLASILSVLSAYEEEDGSLEAAQKKKRKR